MVVDCVASRLQGGESHYLLTQFERVIGHSIEWALCKRRDDDLDTPGFCKIVALSLYTGKRPLSLIYGYAGVKPNFY